MAWALRGSGADRDKGGPDTWYVDLVHLTTERDSITVRDLYVDVLVPTDGRHQRLLDLDEFADAMDAGQLDAGTAADGLRRWQRSYSDWSEYERSALVGARQAGSAV